MCVISVEGLAGRRRSLQLGGVPCHGSGSGGCGSCDCCCHWCSCRWQSAPHSVRSMACVCVHMVTIV